MTSSVTDVPPTAPDDNRPVLELRTYKLVPGGTAAFDRLFQTRALPLLERFEIEVVVAQPSTEADDHYLLVRRFRSASERLLQEDAFYGSDEWIGNHRDAVMRLIESYHTIVLSVGSEATEALIAALSPRTDRRGVT